jgi:hypothetical protein
MAEIVKYLTKLSPDECLHRLESEAVRFSFWQHLRGYPAGTVFRRIRGRSFVLRACLGQRLSNSFEPVFRGSLEPSTEGTLIQGEFGIHRGTSTFMIAWTVFCVAMLVSFVWIIIKDYASGQAAIQSTPYLGVLIGVIMLVFGWALWGVGKHLGAGQRTTIENFLRTKLQAQKRVDLNSAVYYKGFQIIPDSRKLPGENRWRVEFTVRKYDENGELTFEKRIVADNTFKTKKKADIWAIRLSKLMINGEVPGAILEES